MSVMEADKSSGLAFCPQLPASQSAVESLSQVVKAVGVQFKPATVPQNRPTATHGEGLSYAGVLKGGGLQTSPRTSKKSFSQLFEEEQKEGDIKLKQPSTYKGEPAISFSNEEINIMSQAYKFAMVGKFSKRYPEFKLLKPALAKIGFRGGFSVGALKPGFILLNFELEEDFNRIWLKPEWFILGCPMRVFKWTPIFNYHEESAMAAVWVTFPDLPIHLFNKRALFSLANLIGKPVKVDEPTADRTRPSRARVCIEIDLRKEYGSRVWIECGSNGWMPQFFFFENKPSFCSICCRRGHPEADCRFNHAEEKGKAVDVEDIIIKEKIDKISKRLHRQREDENGREQQGPQKKKQSSPTKAQKQKIQSVPVSSKVFLPLQIFESSKEDNQKEEFCTPQHGIAVPIGLFERQDQSAVRNKRNTDAVNCQLRDMASADFQEEKEEIFNISAEKEEKLGIRKEKQQSGEEMVLLSETGSSAKKKKNDILKQKNTVATVDANQFNFDLGQNKLATVDKNFDIGQNLFQKNQNGIVTLTQFNLECGQNSFNLGQNKIDDGQNNCDLGLLDGNSQQLRAGKEIDISTPFKEGKSEHKKGFSDISSPSTSKDKHTLHGKKKKHMHQRG